MSAFATGVSYTIPSRIVARSRISVKTEVGKKETGCPSYCDRKSVYLDGLEVRKTEFERYCAGLSDVK
jgi:hypothetical protein